MIITSDKTESTIHRGLELTAEVLPEKAFYGQGATKKGPSVVMTDDSHTEHNKQYTGTGQPKFSFSVLFIASIEMDLAL